MSSSKSRLGKPSRPKSCTLERTYLFKVWISVLYLILTGQNWVICSPTGHWKGLWFYSKWNGESVDVFKKEVTWPNLAFIITLAVVGEDRMSMSSQKALAPIWRVVMVNWSCTMPVRLWEMVRSKIQYFEGRTRTISWMTGCDIRDKKKSRIIF